MDTAPCKNSLLGILLVVIAMLAFSVMSGFVKAVSHTGLATQQVMFFQNIAALLILLPWILRQGKEVFIPGNKSLVFLRAILGISSMYLFFLAVRLAPLVNAVLLQNTAPLFIPLLALILFKKRIALKVIASMIIGFIGVMLVLNPGRGFLLHPGDIVALSAGFISAVVTIVIGRLEDKDESVATIMLYYLVITILVTGIWSIYAWKMPQGVQWLYLIAAGILYAIFQVLMILSLKYGTPIIISPFIYLGVVFSGLVDWIAWKQVPDHLTIIGAFVVVIGTVLSTLRFPQLRGHTT